MEKQHLTSSKIDFTLRMEKIAQTFVLSAFGEFLVGSSNKLSASSLPFSGKTKLHRNRWNLFGPIVLVCRIIFCHARLVLLLAIASDAVFLSVSLSNNWNLKYGWWPWYGWLSMCNPVRLKPNMQMPWELLLMSPYVYYRLCAYDNHSFIQPEPKLNNILSILW